MAVTASWYGNGLLYVVDTPADLEAVTLNLALATDAYTPDRDTDDFRNDFTAAELANGNGYTTGGVTLSGVTWSYDATSDQVRLDFNDPSWTFTASKTWRYGIGYIDTAGADTTDPLIFLLTWDSNQTVSTAYTLTIPAEGALYLDTTQAGGWMPAGYVADTNGDVALSAATAKTILSVINAANGLIRITEFGVSFDGTSSSAEPVTVELCSSTEATAGTSTSHTIVQSRGPTRTVQATAKRNFTAEPTVLTVLKRWLVHPQTGITVLSPLSRETEQITTADALVIRCTAPAAVNAQAYIEFEEG